MAQEGNTTIIQQRSATEGIVSKILVALGIVGGAWYGNKKYQEYKQTKEQEKAADDPNTNAANQIYSELDKFNPDDAVLINLFSNIPDYKETAKAYGLISKGKDMLTTLQSKTNVGADTIQTILRTLGVKTGAIQATSTTVKTVTETAGKKDNILWLVAKSSVRVRKSPKAYSQSELLLKTVKNVGVPTSNIIDNVAQGETVGFLNTKEFTDNGKKPIYDAAHNVFFLPVLIFVGDAKTVKPAYIAASEVSLVVAKTSPSNPKIFTAITYNFSTSVNGISVEKFNYKGYSVELRPYKGSNRYGYAITDSTGNYKVATKGAVGTKDFASNSAVVYIKKLLQKKAPAKQRPSTYNLM